MRRAIRGVPWFYFVAPAIAALLRLDKLWTPGQFGRLDFRIYYEAVDTTTTASLYDFQYKINNLGFTYPPFTALLLRPLTLFGLVTAERIWFVVSFTLLVWFAHQCARLLPHDNEVVKSLACAFIIASMPVTLTLQFGQINAIIGTLLMIDLLLAARGHRLAGVGLGLASAIKVTPAYLGVVFAAAGRWRHAIVAGVAAIAATLLAAIALPGSSKDYWTSVLYDTDRVGSVDTPFNNSLRRIVGWLGWSESLSTVVWLALSAVVTVIVITRMRRSFAVHNLLAAYTIASIGGYLVSPISWGHHLLFLAPAVALLVGDGRAPIRWAAAIPAIYLVIDRYQGGEDNRLSAYRILFMVMVVAFVPIDERRAARHDAGAMPMPFRWRTAAER